ncbi:hypothetical protein [Neisseria sp.]|uniref:hypothetical protein n=1 Tax=Neisseria sp. TaxID=192066 RepID=UPI00289EB90A|nr:hypothetical protein [Neisseria sp.]
MLHIFPEIPALIGLIPYLTASKMAFGALYLAAFAILGIMVLLRRLRKTKQPAGWYRWLVNDK